MAEFQFNRFVQFLVILLTSMALCYFLIDAHRISIDNQTNDISNTQTTAALTRENQQLRTHWNESIKNNSLIISPLLKLFGGGMTNDEVNPMFLMQDYIQLDDQNDKILVDVGMYDGIAAAQAVTKGYTVFGFEPMPSHIQKIFETFNTKKLSQNIQFINITNIFVESLNSDVNKLRDLFTKEYAIKQYPIKTITNESSYGILYLFQCAVSHTIDVIRMREMGVWSNIGSATNDKSNLDMLPLIVVIPLHLIVYHNVLWFKTDTQGYEYNVLRGSVNLFTNYNVTILTFEYWPWKMQEIYGNDAVKDLLQLCKNELLLDMCFPSRKDGNQFSFSKQISTEQFVNLTLDIESQFHRGFWDDMTCIKY
eukprot:4736_1